MALTRLGPNQSINLASNVTGTLPQANIADEAINEAKVQISNAGSNGEFLSKQSGDTGGLTWAAPSGGSTIVWKATTTASLALDNQGDVAFTDLDLTSVTSADAAGVLISASLRNNTANEYARFIFRKNGTTPDYPAELTSDDSFGANVNHFGMYLIGCDTGQIIEYKIDTESSSTVSVMLSVLGYWE